MSKGTVLITGGAGFIGSHLADELLLHGYSVRALDSLVPQVHGETQSRPKYLDPEVDLRIGDVRDARAVEHALEGVDYVFHFAAAVGVGQSMYDIEHYTSVNNGGTAVLFESVIKKKRIARFIVASSMSVYGEGMYRDASGMLRSGRARILERLRRCEWELADENGHPLSPIPTPETKEPTLESIYALSKLDQERMTLLLGRAYGIPTVALRFFNVFGTRQALSNPYTGVLAIFASRLLNDRRPLVFEDGKQRRDFVSVKDVARACRLALESNVDGEVANIGSGECHSIESIATKMAIAVGKGALPPEISHKYRVGDIRHCFADISRARSLFGYAPTVRLDEGLVELASWLDGQVPRDRTAIARAELEARGLAR